MSNIFRGNKTQRTPLSLITLQKKCECVIQFQSHIRRRHRLSDPSRPKSRTTVVTHSVSQSNFCGKVSHFSDEISKVIFEGEEGGREGRGRKKKDRGREGEEVSKNGGGRGHHRRRRARVQLTGSAANIQRRKEKRRGRRERERRRRRRRENGENAAREGGREGENGY